MGEHRCLSGVMARCPHGDRPVCTYEEGSQCEKDNLAYLPPTIRAEWESYKATGLEPEEIRRMQEYMKPFTIQDMDRFREIMDAEKDGRLVVSRFKHGDCVWVIERDEDGEALDVAGSMFLAEVLGFLAEVLEAVIVSAYINDMTEAEETLSYHMLETVENYDTALMVFPSKDVYQTKAEAETALREAAENA